MKKINIPETRVKNPEPKNISSEDWIIWAAWADRITFEQIFYKTGVKEKEVIKIMKKNLSLSSFKLWRKRVSKKSIKHLKLFKLKRKNLKPKHKKTILSF
ncbi:MAG: TIGR03643 family protein [Rickettsiales bacterium]|mgnify:CR=1 FL=1|nr:TIGR03643 family protein [Rickettsiales bacterium]OUV54136.1 MAG: TIGR03643 family protein [Rickettsiales bacterium TMED127]|tara:strand:- start:54334 stop:54633 length:300 start_codon:yes stop_codon:yes gene_type:complete